MKSFYAVGSADTLGSPVVGIPHSLLPTADPSHIATRARVAVYERPGAAPRVEDIRPAPVSEFIESFTTRIYELARQQGGSVPYTAIREVTENFIHADFAEPVVSILDDGMTIRFADQGPGIPDKERAVLPGFTTARQEMKDFIRGVGSGLPIVRDYLSLSGGSLHIEDNLGGGSVVTLHARRSDSGGARSVASPGAAGGSVDFGSPPGSQHPLDVTVSAGPSLSTRQKQVLALVMESGSAGPSLVAKELGCGVSTAYRDLASLEELSLICSSDGGKRKLTDEGLTCFEHLFNR